MADVEPAPVFAGQLAAAFGAHVWAQVALGVVSSWNRGQAYALMHLVDER